MIFTCIFIRYYMSKYDVTKDELSRFMDRLNHAKGCAENGDSPKELISELKDARAVFEECFPSQWYKERDHDFDNLFEELKTSSYSAEERAESIKDFQQELIERIYDSDLKLEP